MPATWGKNQEKAFTNTTNHTNYTEYTEYTEYKKIIKCLNPLFTDDKS